MDVVNVQKYLDNVPLEKKPAFLRLRATILENLPEGFKEEITYGMIGFVVPLALYPKGYHVGKEVPLPFLGLACQKNYISLYHLGIYAQRDLLDWFTDAFKAKGYGHKLDIGKSCIRFKYLDEIPFDLIGTLVGSMSVREWIDIYEASLRT